MKNSCLAGAVAFTLVAIYANAGRGIRGFNILVLFGVFPRRAFKGVTSTVVSHQKEWLLATTVISTPGVDRSRLARDISVTVLTNQPSSPILQTK